MEVVGAMEEMAMMVLVEMVSSPAKCLLLASTHSDLVYLSINRQCLNLVSTVALIKPISL